MKLVFLFAMKEEADILNSFLPKIIWNKYNGFELCEFSYNNHNCIAIISGVGLSMSAGATALCIEKYKPYAIINIGLAGGINCKIGDIIIAQSAIFHDADTRAFGYELHQLPGLPVKFDSNINLIQKFKLEQFDIIHNAIILSGNQFINNSAYVLSLKNKYLKAAAIEMEAASVASICYKANCAFLLIKKISDLADSNAVNDFSKEVPNFSKATKKILLQILNA